MRPGCTKVVRPEPCGGEQCGSAQQIGRVGRINAIFDALYKSAESRTEEKIDVSF